MIFDSRRRKKMFMPKGNKFMLMPFIVTAAFCILMMIGCGGGSSKDSGTNTPNTGSGKVALYLADAPSDDFDHIWIEVSEIALIPCGDGDPEVIFQSDDPDRIDLLALRDGDEMLLTVQESVPAGEYCKIRLNVDNIEGENGEDLVDIKLSSGKIDLNPKGSFDVQADETLSIQLDIDAEKSIHLAGPNYNFRPVVFINIDDINRPRPFRHIVQGTITELLFVEEKNEAKATKRVQGEDNSEENPPDAEVIGFKLSLSHGHNTIDVMLKENTTIFDAKGQSVGPDALAVDQFVGVKGRLDSEAKLLADLVVIGSTLTVSGTAKTEVDENDTFELDPSAFAPIFGEEAITVSLSAETAITMGDEEVDKTQIQPGQRMRVVGKYDADNETLNAIAIFIKRLEKIGLLTALEPVDGGSLLTILIGSNFERHKVACMPEETEITVFLPESISPEIKGDGALTLDELSQLIACEHPLVQVVLSQEPTEDAPAEALALTVVPRRLDLVTVDTIVEGVITTTTGDTILVTDETKILSHDCKNQEPIELTAIQSGDTLIVSALATCEPTDFLAVTIIKTEPFDPPDDIPCPPEHNRIKLTVAAVGDNTITGEDKTVITITEKTHFLDLSQEVPKEMTLEDIAVGDTLICDVIEECKDKESKTIEALLITRIDPDAVDPFDPPPDWEGCIPKIVKIQATIDAIEERVIVTTKGEAIRVPEGTPIMDPGADEPSELDLEALAAGDQIKVIALTSCDDDDESLTALLIVLLEETSK
jgi:hypothetical protein